VAQAAALDETFGACRSCQSPEARSQLAPKFPPVNALCRARGYLRDLLAAEVNAPVQPSNGSDALAGLPVSELTLYMLKG
jgi:hypothetical protein